MKRNMHFSSILAFGGLLTLAMTLWAAPDVSTTGEPDSSFGGFNGDGQASVPGMRINTILALPNGKVLSAGQSTDSGERIMVVQHRSDGGLDATFGSNGVLATPIVGSANDAVARSDGRILLAGQIGEDFGIVQLLPSGAIDANFGGNGVVTTDFDGNIDEATGIAMLEDGRFVVAGKAMVGGDFDFAVARYLANGEPDDTFHDDGKDTVGFGGNNTGFDEAEAVVVQSDGRIIVAGRVDDAGFLDVDYDFGLARFEVDGDLDSTFDGDGLVSFGMGGDFDDVSDIALLSDNRIVVVGRVTHNDDDLTSEIAIALLHSNGTLDDSFDEDGKVIIDAGIGFEDAVAVSVTIDDRIVVAATSDPGDQNRIEVFSFLTTGTLDTSLGGDGHVSIPAGNNITTDLALLSNGHFLVSHDSGLVRFRPDGELDRSGAVVTSYGPGDDYGSAVAVLPDGKIVVAGEADTSAYSVSGKDIALARYSSGGQLDPTFGAGGRVTFNFPGEDSGEAMVVQTDGKIVVAGIRQNFDDDFAVWRFLPDGRHDPLFKGLGFTTVDFGNGNDFGQAVIIQPDGKIVIAGFAADAGTGSAFALARLEADGDLDPTFGDGGRVVTDFSGTNIRLRAALLQPDGKIVVAGRRQDNMIVLRYLTDGKLDPSFHEDGWNEIESPLVEEARELALLPGGRIAVGGIADDKFSLWLFSGDGVLICEQIANCPPVMVPFSGEAQLTGMAIQSDGKIVLTGTGMGASPGPISFLATRLRFRSFPQPAGYLLDTTFSGDGRAELVIGAHSEALSLALDLNGDLILAGITTNGNDYDFAVTRLLAETSPPPPPDNKAYLPLVR